VSIFVSTNSFLPVLFIDGIAANMPYPGYYVFRGDGFYGRLRAVSYFSLQSYCTQNLSTRAAKPLAARNEGVSPRRKNKRPSFLVLSRYLTSWFAIALDEIKNQADFKRKGGLQAVYFYG